MADSIQHNSYQDYLIHKHSQFNTPEFVIDEKIKKATGSIPVSKTKLILGEVNEVYDVLTQDGQKVIVRISRSKHPRFEAEKKAINLARVAGVPAPQIIMLDKYETPEEVLTFCIEKKLPGETLSKLKTLPSENPELFQNLICEAGKILSRIHSATAPVFGGLDKEGTEEEFKSWPEFILALEKKREKITQAATRTGIEMSDIDEAFKILTASKDLYEGVKPQLLHGDFSTKHLLVEGNHITGVIDFENCKGGDPVYDFAWFDYFYGHHIPLDWLKKGYQNKQVLEDRFKDKLFTYKIYLGLGFIDYYQSENNQPGINHTKMRLQEDLGYFRGSL